MSNKLGGGGVKCKSCGKTCYMAEQVSFDKTIYHDNCFRCCKCKKKLSENMSSSTLFEDNLYCQGCGKKEGISEKQKKSTKTWKKSSGTGSGKWGGGGTPCTVCKKTVYSAERVSFEKKIYHKKCFQCFHCHKKIPTSDGNIGQEKGKEPQIYCSKHFKELRLNTEQAKVKWTKKEGSSTGGSSKFGGTAESCVVCSKAVYMNERAQYGKTKKRVWHPKCITCFECKKKRAPEKVKIFNDENLICDQCWQREGYNRKQLVANTPKSDAKKPATDSRFKKFGGGGNKCNICKKTVYPAETLQFEKHFFHSACFTCSVDTCGTKLSAGKATYKKHGDEITIFCVKCFNQLGLNRATLETHEDKAPDDEAPAEEAPKESEEEAPVEEATREELD